MPFANGRMIQCSGPGTAWDLRVRLTLVDAYRVHASDMTSHSISEQLLAQVDASASTLDASSIRNEPERRRRVEVYLLSGFDAYGSVFDNPLWHLPLYYQETESERSGFGTRPVCGERRRQHREDTYSRQGPDRETVNQRPERSILSFTERIASDSPRQQYSGR